MRKAILLLIVMSLFVCGVTTSQAVASCSENEIFRAYGFYGGERFPQSISLMGPFSTFEECHQAEKAFVQKSKN